LVQHSLYCYIGTYIYIIAVFIEHLLIFPTIFTYDIYYQQQAWFEKIIVDFYGTLYWTNTR